MALQRHKSLNIHPGIILKEEVIIPEGLTIGEAAEHLNTTRLTLSKIVNGKSGITPNMALRIQYVFGGTAELWLRMQRKYDLIEAEDFFEVKGLKKIAHH
jgi:addiction module HigA family antidote